MYTWPFLYLYGVFVADSQLQGKWSQSIMYFELFSNIDYYQQVAASH